ncbi:hypothetical protein TVAG_413500 [Trichomonas vaginalis G3]|uniref:DUF3447 domain-containing protein n=1 Tax=Trichomonas vaginalis (strain ATCC PRA-98 / G3) TaxID=412133 RepID=A2F9I3_TRIV3|nr:protein of unknown function (DUF3447) [Trichomonas vaginalis G3]EAX98454.1 hypothetical protein TVAG_413500 [Trichomonas vaginalis G3]KAI5493612.1 protein of unknown function (DUF3447) [Trichomonas vaginalis G3]|eukprot:XP_001311384.1 hypothetical protein [Trichomonas vaginalis G3]
MSECLKYQKPDKYCMKYAIISYNIDFNTFLMNEYNIKIDLEYCGIHNNLDSFLVYYDQTNDIDRCFIYSTVFDISSICEYFLLHGANICEKYNKVEMLFILQRKITVWKLSNFSFLMVQISICRKKSK